MPRRRKSALQLGRGRVIDIDQAPPPVVAAVLLLQFTEGDRYLIDVPLQQLVVATFQRSRDTFSGVLSLIADGLPVQGAMLARSLFEDVVVAHWLVLNREDPDWLVDRFFRHREAIALHAERLHRKTTWQFGDVAGVDLDAARRRQNDLVKEFGPEAQQNWWDPCSEGGGSGRPIGLRGVAGQLEDAAADHDMFHPRFAGGDEPMLRRMEEVVQKWFSQCLHHTAIGLPIIVTGPAETPGEQADPTALVLFVSWWMFTQQIYLLHDLYDRPYDDFNEIVKLGFTGAFGASEGDLKPFPTT